MSSQIEMLPSPPDIHFYPAADRCRLAARVWHAVDTPIARVVFLHGITSHGGWYEQVARYLANAGCEVHFLDRRGSGLNAREPGDIDNWRTWVGDVAAYIHSIRGNNLTDPRPQPPTILCGISWGGKLAPVIARLHANLVDGIALICPGIYSPFLPRRVKRAILATPAPTRLQNLRLTIPLRHPELFTNTRPWREFIRQDPLALRRVTWRFAQADRELTAFARASAPFIHMPLLLMLARQDRIVDNRRTRAFFARAQSRHKTLLEYAGAGHTLEFEADPSQYFRDLADWIHKTAMLAAA
jgi:acylglycerol lipase